MGVNVIESGLLCFSDKPRPFHNLKFKFKNLKNFTLQLSLDLETSFLFLNDSRRVINYSVQ